MNVADNMIYEAQGLTLDLSKITRLYPAALVEGAGAEAQVSLEWAELKKEEVRIDAYILVFDFDLPGELPENRKILQFATKGELFDAMHEVARYFEA